MHISDMSKNMHADPIEYIYLVAYLNKTVVEMQSEQLCRQVGIGGDMLPSDIPDNCLCARTGSPIEIRP